MPKGSILSTLWMKENHPLSQMNAIATAQKMKFSIKDFFSKSDQIGRRLRIWSHLLKKSLIKNFIFCAVCSMPR